ncbi:hypothetical protein BCR42DRAFT_50835 [Absidia repens]|uniref:Zn(2)-C6 fungal-type domain-containing protein n=1 Tax=Absidia repens TaxID=90262 RepID=A0A1X2IEY3_9FUNG|nr:hypothetical protein BCR42DRAFT_50835 [Absidia repens]
MLLCSQKKTHPCEGCRERKKKCSGEYPCVRCDRLGNECVFLQPTLPPDHAYVNLLQEQELSLELETLNSSLLDMERTMTQLHRNTSDKYNGHKRQMTHQRMTSNTSQQQQQQQDIIHNWQLILSKHGITVNTSIKSYSDLLKQAELWQQACQSFTTPPLFRSPPCPFSPSGMVLRRQLPLWLLRRGYFMAITMCVKTQQSTDRSLATALPATPHNLLQHQLGYQQQQPSPPLSEHESIKQDDDTPPMTIIAATTTSFNDNPDKLCRHILDTFFACYVVRYTILHQRTFYRLFVTPIASSSSSSSLLLDSPVICAVCAVALTIRCRHMLPSIPYQHQVQMADILYRRARDIVDFDEPTLATFIVLSFLAMYKQLIFCVEEASFYLDMAFRTRCLLVDDDDDDNDDDDDVDEDTRGERELIKRLHWALWETQTSVEYYKNQRGVPQSTTTTTTKSSSTSSLCCNSRSENPITTLMKEKKDHYRRRPLPDEPPIIHQTLRNAHYRSEMMAAQGSFLRRVRFGNNDTIDVNYLADTEYRFSNYYYQDIPADCRMPPGILEEGLSDSDFRKRLDTHRGHGGGGIGCVDEDDDGNRTAALSLTLQYFQGVISLYEPFLPDLKDRQRAQGAGLLKDDGDTPSFSGSSSTTKAGSKFIKEEETSARITGESEVTMHQLRAQQKCTHAATSIVRLLDYQRSLPRHCTVNIHILLTAWDIHMRNACLGMTIPPDNGDDQHDNSPLYFHCLTPASIHQARRSLLQCLSILREGYLFNFAEHAVWEYYEHVEQQLLSSLPRQHPSTAPTAAYWIPFGS